MNQIIKGSLCLLMALLLASCVRVPDGMTPVTEFNAERYLGTWYEIARLEHRFEEGLSRVTANYSYRDDGGIRVLNRGYDAEKGRWEDAEGRAYFVEDDSTAYLKVSFFGPFYGAYVVFHLDEEYEYAFVSGPDTSYLWLLSRTPEISDEVKELFIAEASQHGFVTDELIWVDQSAID